MIIETLKKADTESQNSISKMSNCQISVEWMYGYLHWDLFLLETRVIFLTFFSLLHHFLVMNKEIQPWGRFAKVKSQLGEIWIWIPTKRLAPCLKNQTYRKWNVHKQKTKIKCIPTFLVIRLLNRLLSKHWANKI